MEKRIELRAGGELDVCVADGVITLDGRILTKNEAVAISRALLEAFHAASKHSTPTVKRLG